MFSISSEWHTGFTMPRALIGHQENCIPMLYSGTVWRLNDWEYPKVCVNLQTDVR